MISLIGHNKLQKKLSRQVWGGGAGTSQLATGLYGWADTNPSLYLIFVPLVPTN